MISTTLAAGYACKFDGRLDNILICIVNTLASRVTFPVREREPRSYARRFTSQLFALGRGLDDRRESQRVRSLQSFCGPSRRQQLGVTALSFGTDQGLSQVVPTGRHSDRRGRVISVSSSRVPRSYRRNELAECHVFRRAQGGMYLRRDGRRNDESWKVGYTALAFGCRIAGMGRC